MAGNEKNTIVLLGAGLLQIPFMQAARELGFRVLALDQNHAAVGRETASEFLHVQIADADAVIAALKPFAGQLAFVTTVATDFSHIVGCVNDALQLPGLTTKQGEVLTHKGKMRDFCKAHGHLHPPYTFSESKDELAAFMRANHCADGFVIKPVQNMGARGVMLIKNADDLAYAFEFSAAAAGPNAQNAQVIVEHFVPAREISVDALCFEGRVMLTGVADRLIEIKDAHFFIENGHTLPADIKPQNFDTIRETLQRYADSLSALSGKAYHGALKGDLRLTASGEIVIGEIAGRLSGGFMSTHTYPAAHGKNLMQLFIRLMMFDRSIMAPAGEDTATQAIAIERSLYAEPGELAGIKSRAELDALQAEYKERGLILVHGNYRSGDSVQNLQNNIGKVYHTVIRSQTLAAAEALFAEIKPKLAFASKTPDYNARAMAKIARENFNNSFCWVCKVCDGGYCASGVPGMGARGEMNTFRDNVQALAEYKIVPGYLSSSSNVAEVDTTLKLFGRDALTLAAPILSAPITGSVTNMGGSITEFDYAIETGSAMASLGLMPTFGDGASADKYRVGLHAIELIGRGFPVFKPRTDQQELLRRIAEAERAGAVAWGIDIDGVSFKTMVLKNAATSRKTPAELKELVRATKLPAVIKGVMSIADAEAAAAAGAAAIVVSNHGGRVLDGMPGTARVLPAISAWVKQHAGQMQVFADGGIRSGADIFRMLALGADAVLIGRPIAIMAVGLGRVGVQSLMNHYIAELRQTMRVLGISRLEEIRPNHVTRLV
ncbi:alpha-hydroxy-acid oxidizing protein [Turneriella parva]|uniref:Ferredoxin-dependent glutamate synthase n=1 Tax=Turneriella parva (strain ATCC BAA-1111 / DSM 21527 / NCTC 11395 / H) TaxID=869212 RepID=I4B894_TURPD|nr:alpha-hydroxy-acid oxidizing protein [Turneriella parva]AFM13501.1 ferredoxin-dependent glutamate synthase [Turneriella parva DSM 21527]